MAYRVTLNTQELLLLEKPGFRQLNKDPFLEHFDPDAQRSQTTLAVDSKVFGPLIYGIGREEIPTLLSKDPTQYQMYFDGIFDGRWPTGIYGALLRVAVTDTGIERVWAFADFKGKLEALWTESTTGNHKMFVVEYDSATPDWVQASGALVHDNTQDKTGLDMVAYKDKLVTMYAGLNDHIVHHSTDTITWTISVTPITTNLLGTNVTDNQDVDGGKLVEIGGELVAVVWHAASSLITFFSTTDVITWTDEAVDISDTPFAGGGGVKGAAKILAPNDIDHLIVGTRAGLWDVDVSAGTWIITSINSPISAHPDSCRNMVNHNSELWYPQGVSTNDVFQVWRMFIGTNGKWQHEPTPGSPHLRDGLPTDMLGTVTAMASSGGFCYIAVGGGKAGRKATIFCHNSKGWHPIAQLATENRIIHTMAVSAEDDGTVRLHFDEKVGTDDSEPIILENINAHPNTALSIAREAVSTVTLPRFDGGFPNTKAAWLKVRGKISDLDATNSGEYVEVKYGKDGEANNANTDLGNALVDDGTHDQNDFYSNAKVLSWVAQASTPFIKPEGVESVTMGLELTLNGVTPATPRGQAIEVDYLRIPEIINEFTFDVDLRAMLELSPGTSAASIVSTLRTALASKILVEFTNNDATTIYVHVDHVEERLIRAEEGEQGDLISSSRNDEIILEGTVGVTVSQVIT